MKSFGVLVIVLMAALVIWVTFLGSAFADRTEKLALCNIARDAPQGRMKIDGFMTRGEMYLDLANIAGVIPLPYQENCTVVHTLEGQYVSVVGSAQQILCQWKGGCWCEEEKGQ